MAKRVRHSRVAGVAVAVSLALSLAGSLTGCGSEKASDPTRAEVTPTSSPTATPTVTPTGTPSANAESPTPSAMATAEDPTSDPAPAKGETAPVAADAVPTTADTGAFCQAFVDSIRDSASATNDLQVQAKAYRTYVDRLVEIGSTPEMTESERAGMVVFINVVRAQTMKDMASGKQAEMTPEETEKFSAFAQYRLKVCDKQVQALSEELSKP